MTVGKTYRASPSGTSNTRCAWPARAATEPPPFSHRREDEADERAQVDQEVARVERGLGGLSTAHTNTPRIEPISPPSSWWRNLSPVHVRFTPGTTSRPRPHLDDSEASV